MTKCPITILASKFEADLHVSCSAQETEHEKWARCHRPRFKKRFCLFIELFTSVTLMCRRWATCTGLFNFRLFANTFGRRPSRFANLLSHFYCLNKCRNGSGVPGFYNIYLHNLALLLDHSCQRFKFYSFIWTTFQNGSCGVRLH